MADELPITQTGSVGLVDRAKSIVMTPKAEWPKVAAETKSPTEVLLQYALPLMAIGPICSVLGGFLAPYNLGLTYYVSTAIVSFALGIAALFALSFIANVLSPNFGGKNDFASAFKLVAYSWTPVWLFGVFGLLVGLAPALALLGFLALLYGLYLFYLGSGPVMGVPQDKSAVYTAIYVVAAFVLYIIVGSITAAIVASFIVASSPAAVIVYS
jgi:hypothetical protein